MAEQQETTQFMFMDNLFHNISYDVISFQTMWV